MLNTFLTATFLFIQGFAFAADEDLSFQNSFANHFALPYDWMDKYASREIRPLPPSPYFLNKHLIIPSSKLGPVEEHAKNIVKALLLPIAFYELRLTKFYKIRNDRFNLLNIKLTTHGMRLTLSTKSESLKIKWFRTTDGKDVVVEFNKSRTQLIPFIKACLIEKLDLTEEEAARQASTSMENTKARTASYSYAGLPDPASFDLTPGSLGDLLCCPVSAPIELPSRIELDLSSPSTWKSNSVLALIKASTGDTDAIEHALKTSIAAETPTEFGLNTHTATQLIDKECSLFEGFVVKRGLMPDFPSAEMHPSSEFFFSVLVSMDPLNRDETLFSFIHSLRMSYAKEESAGEWSLERIGQALTILVDIYTDEFGPLPEMNENYIARGSHCALLYAIDGFYHLGLALLQESS